MYDDYKGHGLTTFYLRLTPGQGPGAGTCMLVMIARGIEPPANAGKAPVFPMANATDLTSKDFSHRTIPQMC